MCNVIVDRYETFKDKIRKTRKYEQIYKHQKHKIICEDGIIIIELYMPKQEAILF